MDPSFLSLRLSKRPSEMAVHQHQSLFRCSLVGSIAA